MESRDLRNNKQMISSTTLDDEYTNVTSSFQVWKNSGSWISVETRFQDWNRSSSLSYSTYKSCESTATL